MSDTLKIQKVPITTLTPHPRNVRQGDVGAIIQSLQAHGQYRPIVVQRSSNHILAGNHTYKAAVQLGWDSLSVVYVDVDDDEALRILLVDNRTNDLASYDESGLVDVLKSLIETERRLEGTGYDGDDIDALLRGLDDSPSDLDSTPQMAGLEYRLIVECTDEEHQRVLMEEFTTKGLTVRAVVS